MCTVRAWLASRIVSIAQMVSLFITAVAPPVIATSTRADRLACTPHQTAIAGPRPGVFGGEVAASAVHDDGSGCGPRVVVGGSFTQAGALPIKGIAMWDLHNWAAIGDAAADPLNTEVFAMTVFADANGPQRFVGGQFTTIRGISAKYIAARGACGG